MNPDSLIYPRGELQPAWFGTDEIGLVTLVSTWADAAAGESAAIVEATVYARGYRAAADGLHAMPTSSSLPDGNSWSYSADQREYWQRRADYWEGRRDELVLSVPRRGRIGITGVRTR